MNDAEKLEVMAETYKVIRANQDKSRKEILALIYEHLPDVPKKEIVEALKALL